MTIPADSEFLWRGVDLQNRRVRGVSIAKNQTLACEQLRQQGIRVLEIRLKPAPWFNFAPRIRSTDITVFTRQLANLMHVGIPLLQALDIIRQGQANPSLIKLITELQNAIRNGDSLSQAMAQKPACFDTFVCNLVATGEQAGVLAFLLEKLACYRENIESLKQKVRKALTYPVTVLLIALTVTMILLIWVIPTFEDLFTSFAAELPLLTLTIIRLSKNFQHYGWLIALGLAAIGCAIFSYQKYSGSFNYKVQLTLLRLPLIGTLIRKSVIARFALTLGTVLAAGLPLVDGLLSVAAVCGNPIYEDAIIKIRTRVSGGQSLEFAMHQSQLFPPLVIQMITIGENSGTLDAMLIKIADYYKEEVNYLIDHLTSLIEPLLMVILGLLIGGLILAMYLPIFSLGKVIA